MINDYDMVSMPLLVMYHRYFFAFTFCIYR